jgi:hypothetical protein
LQKITSDDPRQCGYVYFVNPDAPLAPAVAALITPPDMLRQGIYGGHYFERYHMPAEFPFEWGYHARRAPRYDWRLNKYRVDTRIGGRPFVGSRTPDDPRGYFQWLCRYTLGRRIAALDEQRLAELAHYQRIFGEAYDKAKSHMRRKHALQCALEFGVPLE